MHVGTITQSVGSLLYVITPVTTFLDVGADWRHLHVMHLFSLRLVVVIWRYPSLAGILHAHNKVLNLPFTLGNSFLALLVVNYALTLAQLLPIFIANLHLIAGRGRVAYLRTLTDTNHHIDIVPSISKCGSPVWHRIVLESRSWES